MSNSIGHTASILHAKTFISLTSSIGGGGGAPIGAFRVGPVALAAGKRNARLRWGVNGKRLVNWRRSVSFPMATRRDCLVARAVLTTDYASEHERRFNLDGDIDLQVDVTPPLQGHACKIEFRVSTSNDNLVLHWGAIRDQNEGWTLPAHRPEGTRVYKNRALRTSFQKSAVDSSLKLEVNDPSIQAIEFLILDEGQNKWFKNNGGNFHVKLPQKAESISIQDVSIPEELVQIQAFLRWERKGKQNYTPEQEKAEYEAARAELLEDVAKGISVEEIRRRLTKGNDQGKAKEKPQSLSGSRIPDELVQIQAYIRWEKAGKPSYSPDKQLREFEEARKELQVELDKGSSLDEIRQKIIKGDIQTKVSKQLEKKSYFTPERIQRKKRDVMEMLNKYVPELVEERTFVKQKVFTAVELFADATERDAGPKLFKKIYNLGDKQLLVRATKPGKIKVLLVTDLKEPVALHWGLSKNNGEWLVRDSSFG
ncbi:Alpha-glucan water dikinase, chloroplastic-like protein, partial [Drosera capensis]